jgi:hypothetical protein
MKKIFLSILFMVLAVPAFANIVIESGSTLEVVSSSTASTDYIVTYEQVSSTDSGIYSTQGNIATATATGILTPAAGSVQRKTRLIRINNKSPNGTFQTVQLRKNVNNTNYYVIAPTSTLAPGEGLQIDSEGKLTLLDNTGREKQSASFINGFAGFTLPFFKSGSASEAAAIRYSYAKDGGTPGALTVTSADTMNGYVTDCSVYGSWTSPIGSGFMGAPTIPNASSGNLYISNVALASSVANMTELIDVVWINKGLNTIITTRQNIPSFPALPLRDLDGTANGRGYEVAMMFTLATANGAVISNSTIDYTNDRGVAGRIATLDANATSSFPASPVTGTWVTFKRQAGDQGIRSIQNVILGTSLVGSGTPVYMVLYRPLVAVPNPIANVGGAMALTGSGEPPGVRIYNGTCMWMNYLSSATTATVTSGTVSIVER